MKHTYITNILVLLSILSCTAANDGIKDSIPTQDTTIVSDTVFSLTFDNLEEGILTDAKLLENTGTLEWQLLDSRSSITNDLERGKVLKVKYPKGGVGPSQGGIQFLKSIPSSNEYYLNYYIMLEEGFDFRLGGKLPGLTSGGDTYTGGKIPSNGEGWSARYMWVKEGKAVVYLYYVDMTHEYGEPIQMNFQFETNKWYRLTQHIKVNEDNLGNGELQVWVDGESVLKLDKVRYRLWEKGLIDSFYFSTFFGGATAEWAPNIDSYARFDNITITRAKPNLDNN